jgi:hypothetical protein
MNKLACSVHVNSPPNNVGSHTSKEAACLYCSHKMGGTVTDVLRKHLVNRCPNIPEAAKLKVQEQLDGLRDERLRLGIEEKRKERKGRISERVGAGVPRDDEAVEIQVEEEGQK